MTDWEPTHAWLLPNPAALTINTPVRWRVNEENKGSVWRDKREWDQGHGHEEQQSAHRSRHRTRTKRSDPPGLSTMHRSHAAAGETLPCPWVPHLWYLSGALWRALGFGLGFVHRSFGLACVHVRQVWSDVEGCACWRSAIRSWGREWRSNHWAPLTVYTQRQGEKPCLVGEYLTCVLWCSPESLGLWVCLVRICAGLWIAVTGADRRGSLRRAGLELGARTRTRWQRVLHPGLESAWWSDAADVTHLGSKGPRTDRGSINAAAGWRSPALCVSLAPAFLASPVVCVPVLPAMFCVCSGCAPGLDQGLRDSSALAL